MTQIESNLFNDQTITQRNDLQLTQTEKRVVQLLLDGQSHLRSEILAVLKEGAQNGAVKVMIHQIRKKIAPRGFDILCVWDRRRAAYRMVRQLANPYDGST